VFPSHDHLAHNSSYSSVRFPPYYLGRFPDKNIICASYGEGLATSFGRKVRNIVDSKEYHTLYDVKLAEDARAKGEWETANGGSYFAAGVGSGVTGRRGDCLTGDTKVTTNDGEKRIDEIDITSKTCYILSYDKSPIYSKILAVAKRQAESYFEIHTSSGKMVKVTGNHRIYTESGYKKASDIAEGEMLLSLVSEGSCASGLRLQEKRKERWSRILFDKLCWIPLECREWKSTSKMQDLWGSIKSKNSIKILFKGMQENKRCREWKKANNPTRYRMQKLWNYFQTPFQSNEILLNGLQECWSFKENEWEKQPSLIVTGKPLSSISLDWNGV
jgi:hypothetical protein